MSTAKPKDEGTGHKKVPGELDQPALGNKDGSMPMGMTGSGSEAGDGDPDQKSTQNAPNTVESNLPDGSPKYTDADDATRARMRATKGGRFKVLSPIQVGVGTPDRNGKLKSKQYQVGEIVELSKVDAESFINGEIEPAK